MPLAVQYSTTPLRTLWSCHRLSSTCTASTPVMRRASSIWPTVTLHRPIAVDQPAAPQRVQRAHARRERHARIRRVQLIEVDSFDAQGDQARFARRGQRAGAAVGFPSPLGPGQAALGRDADAGTVPAPRSQRAGNEPFVVAGFRGVEAVGVGRVEERDTRVQRSVQHLNPAGLVAIGGGREAHAADRDRRLHHCKSNLSDRKVGGAAHCGRDPATAADATRPQRHRQTRRRRALHGGPEAYNGPRPASCGETAASRNRTYTCISCFSEPSADPAQPSPKAFVCEVAWAITLRIATPRQRQPGRPSRTCPRPVRAASPRLSSLRRRVLMSRAIGGVAAAVRSGTPRAAVV